MYLFLIASDKQGKEITKGVDLPKDGISWLEQVTQMCPAMRPIVVTHSQLAGFDHPTVGQCVLEDNTIFSTLAFHRCSLIPGFFCAHHFCPIGKWTPFLELTPTP